VLPLSDQLLSLGFKRKWPWPILRAQPALGWCASSCTGSVWEAAGLSGSGSQSQCEFGHVSGAGEVEYGLKWEVVKGHGHCMFCWGSRGRSLF